VSGGTFTPADAALHAAAGADLLVTATPYDAAPRDVQVTIEPL
jgi:predicted nuclease with TOPRIM domain